MSPEQGLRSAARERAASAARWGLSQGLPRGALRLASLRGDPVAPLLMDPGRDDAMAIADGLRRRGPVVLTGALGAVPGHAAANAVLRSDSFGVGGGHGELPPHLRRLLDRVTRDRARGPVDPPSMLAVDPPQHTRYRRLVAKAFTPRHVAVLEDRIAETADELLAALASVGGFDLVARYASQLPVAVIGDLLGVDPKDRQDLLRWGDSAALLLDPGLSWRQFREAERAMVALADWFTAHVRRLRADPGDDLLSRLAVLGGDDALDEVELRAVGLLVLAAGFETTVSLISNAVALLDRHPAQLSKLKGDPDLWGNAVDEVLRYDSPVQLTMRVAYEDAVIEGVRLGRGQSLILLLAGANRDPAVFDDPHTFAVTRPNAADHIAFSSGVHYCLGAGLARLEARVALRMLYERFPGLRVSGVPQRRRTRVLRGYERLPVAVGP
ncbi:cytochrome P450 [Streptomyces sp. A7024]|uniref:Cytochrome P450 n=1 Tax=Streptomyces coryli TaxID=1128680 RepID=A0A6G4TTU0_9ACTN|nr:cytochrome P450 [Streptomyces coryli]NGN62960.1 cytochrome P450 [Streptomyces coryli]